MFIFNMVASRESLSVMTSNSAGIGPKKLDYRRLVQVRIERIPVAM